MIKGGGGALTRENISRRGGEGRFVCICDASKLVPVLASFRCRSGGDPDGAQTFGPRDAEGARRSRCCARISRPTTAT
jgi:hypothetical protein